MYNSNSQNFVTYSAILKFGRRLSSIFFRASSAQNVLIINLQSLIPTALRSVSDGGGGSDFRFLVTGTEEKNHAESHAAQSLKAHFYRMPWYPAR